MIDLVIWNPRFARYLAYPTNAKSSSGDISESGPGLELIASSHDHQEFFLECDTQLLLCSQKDLNCASQ